MTDITLRVTADRMRHMTNRTMRLAQKNTDEMYNFVAHFMVNGDGTTYLPREVAIDLLDDHTVGDMLDAVLQIQSLMKEAAAPKATGTR